VPTFEAYRRTPVPKRGSASVLPSFMSPRRFAPPSARMPASLFRREGSCPRPFLQAFSSLKRAFSLFYMSPGSLPLFFALHDLLLRGRSSYDSDRFVEFFPLTRFESFFFFLGLWSRSVSWCALFLPFSPENSTSAAWKSPPLMMASFGNVPLWRPFTKD